MQREPSLYVAYVFWVNLIVPSATEFTQLHNAACKKTAIQSSTYHNARATNAIDGNINAGISNTAQQHQPYWTVDLGDVYDIDHINVYSYSGYATRADINVNVHIYLSVDDVNYTGACYHAGKIPDPYTCKPVGRRRARWVKLKQVKLGYLVLNEVEVMINKDHFKYVTSVQGTGSVLQIRPVFSDVQCTYYCSRTTNCISVNVVTNPTGMECQLLESDVSMGTSDAIIAYWKMKDLY